MCTVWLHNAFCIPTDARNVFDLPGFDTTGRLHFARSVLEVASSLHDLGLAHRDSDIKFDNVLIVFVLHSPPHALPRYIDFAAASTRHVKSGEVASSMACEWERDAYDLPDQDLTPRNNAQPNPSDGPLPCHPPAVVQGPILPSSTNTLTRHSSKMLAAVVTAQRAVQPASVRPPPLSMTTPPVRPATPCCDDFCMQGCKGGTH